jgi:phosphoribosyl 1,2-cyclic phosphodiesterase
MNRYGGNTSCVEVTLSDSETLILDAGTGIRTLGVALATGMPNINILLTHLHLDHIQGLMFFPPCFKTDSRITIWGPASPEASLEHCDVSFRDTPPTEWEIGAARIRAESVTHRGPTLGYRVTEGDTSLCYIPDHEPGLGAPLDDVEPEWLSGFGLARGADLLIHDCQYTDEEYPEHIGWGHSPLHDALTFARRTEIERLVLFHHDPLHTDDFLDGFRDTALERWEAVGGRADRLELAAERTELALGSARELAAS